MLVIFLFIVGLFFGSFFNVVADRSSQNKSFISGRSMCDACKHILSALDLIPVISFLIAKGKCRYCHTHLSWFYLLSEVVTGSIFALTFYQLSSMYQVSSSMNAWIFVYYLFIVSCLLIIFFTDLKYMLIPFSVLFPAIVVAGLFTILYSPLLIVSSLLSAAGAGGFFLLLFLITKGKGMGFGDVVFAFFMGLFLGYPNIIVGLYLAFLTGTAVSLMLVVIKRKKIKGTIIPFGPFLVTGTYIAFLWGSSLLNVFLHFFNL